MVYGLGDEIRHLTEEVIKLENGVKQDRANERAKVLREVEAAWIESGIDATTNTYLGKQVDAGLRCSVFWKWLHERIQEAHS